MLALPRVFPCLALTVLLLLPSGAGAVPAPPFPLALADADGRVVEARMLGDERLSWFETLDGFAIARDPQSGTWRYARRDRDGALAPGPHRVGRADPRALQLEQHLRPGPGQLERAAQRLGPPPPKPAPLRGTVPNLVILARFANHATTYSPADFEALFNAERDSVRAYFREVSGGRLDLVSTVTDWVELPSDDLHYAYNAQFWGSPQDLLYDSVRILGERGFDFTRFDADGDGIIDGLGIIHSGPSYETTGNLRFIHSHYSRLGYAGVRTHDGILIPGYHTEAELGPAGITQIGVIAHESGHFFGLPDLYDTTYRSAGLGLWCLMAAGSWSGPGGDGTSPAHLSAWGKVKLGFLDPVELDAPAARVLLTPVATGGEVVRIRGHLPDPEYFLLENRRRLGFDAYLPGEGLLVFHVDEEMWGNTASARYLVDLEQADGRRDLNLHRSSLGDETDPWPLPGKDAFTASSTPNSAANGTGAASVYLTGIAREERDVSFSLRIERPLPLGAACAAGPVCASGACAEGLCCSEACEDPCWTCLSSRGATADGVCTPATGLVCEDPDPCIVESVCVEGLCMAGKLKPCAPIDACHDEGTCQPGSGACTAPRRPDGTGCDDANACTRDDSCEYGFCQGIAKLCEPAGECRLAGVCDPASGECSAPPVADGTRCSKGECEGGACRSRLCGCSAGGGLLSGLWGLAALGLLRRRCVRSR